MTTARILSPIGVPQTAGNPPAERLDRLAGRTIGLADNQKPNAGLFLKMLGEFLQARDGVAEIVLARKEVTPNQPIDYRKLEGRAAAVVSAWGD